MSTKDIKFINDGDALIFDVVGFAINPQDQDAWWAGDLRDILLTIVGTGNVQVLGSTQRLPPDFTRPSTITNSYAPIVLADYSLTNTVYAGATGVTVAASTAIVELNTNLLTWIAIFRSANTVDVLLTETNAQ